MKLRIVAVGHRMPQWISAGYEDYARRMPREMSLTLTELKPEPRGDKPSAGDIARIVEQEAQRIEAALPKSGITVVLVTHEADIARYAERIISFRDGLVVADERVGNRLDAAVQLAGLDAASAMESAA